MTFKALLLGSAAALATAGVSGGAQAADLMAESVDYVRVCDAFGTGYWYIPGTDQCLKIGGRVRFWLDLGEGAGGDEKPGMDWQFRTQARFDFTYAKMTTHGPLIGFLRSSDSTVESGNNGSDWRVNEAYIQWGHLTFGFFDSLMNTGGGFSEGGDSFGRADSKPNQIQYSQQFGGHTLSLGVEDPKYEAEDSSTASGDIPNLTVRLDSSWEHVDWGVAAGFADGGSVPSGWAVAGFVEFGLDEWWHGASFKASAIYSQDAGGLWVKGLTPVAGDTWAWLASYEQGLTDEWTFSATYSAIHPAGAADAWSAAIDLTYAPTSKFKVQPFVNWAGGAAASTTTTGGVLVEYSF